MAAITHVGNHLLIIRGKWRGCIGEIKEIKQLPCGLFDYLMEIDLSIEDSYDSVKVTIPADDCREYNPGNINLESPFDITNYLSVNQMKDVAKEIYISKVNTYLDDIFNNRRNIGCGNVAQQVLNEVINQYAGKMVDQYKDDILNIFKKVIESDLPASGDEDEKCFGRSIQWALERCATKYIEEHPDEIQEVMKAKIYESSKRMIEEKWSYSLNKAIEKTAEEFIKQTFETTEKK